MLAALQFYFTYPETAGKTLEEIEILFAPGGPKPWKTRKGDSRLDAMVEEAREKGVKMADVSASGERKLSITGSANEQV